MYDYENNLLEWLTNYVTRQVAEKIDSGKFQSEEIYWSFLNEKQRKFVKNTNLSQIIGLIPSQYLVWTIEHQLAVSDWVQRITLGSNQNDLTKIHNFKGSIWLVSAVLAVFEQNGFEETPEFKALEELLRFLRNEFSQSFPLDYQICEDKIAHRQLQETESRRPTCPECQSEHVVSSGHNWQCQSCGRQFRKNPRRKL
jgi:hypothetical protein